MKLPQAQLFIYCIFQIILICFCNEITSFQGSSEKTSDQELIDPHSIYYNRYKKEMEKPVNDEKSILNSDITTNSISTDTTETVDSVKCDCEQKSQDCKDEKFEIFYKRLVKLLLLHVDFKEENEIVEGNVYIRARKFQIQALRDFETGKVLIRTVDSILSEIITIPDSTLLEDAITFSELLLLIINRHRYTCIGIVVAISILWVSRYITWTRGKIIFLIIDLIFVISFFMTWYQLVQEAEIKQTAKQLMFEKMPIECQPENMSTFRNFISMIFFFNNLKECEKYFEARMVNPVSQVTPAQVLSHLCVNFILQPITLVGHGIADFIEACTGKVFWTYRWSVTLILFIGVALLLFMVPFSLFGGSIGFGIGPLFHFTLSGSKKNETKKLNEVKSQERIELIREVPIPINITIQNIESSSTKKGEKNRVIKLYLNDKESKDEEILPKNDFTSDCFDQAKGDSATMDENTEEEARQLELSDKDNYKTKAIQEVGSGDG